MKKPNWKNIGVAVLVIGLLAYLVFAVVRFSTGGDDKICSSLIITVKDSAQLQFISEADVLEALIDSKVRIRKQRLGDINTEEIEQILAKIPVVKKVDCYITSSGGVNIDVWQREPLFRVCGLYNYYVDVEGKILPLSRNFTMYVPVVSGSVNKQFATSKLKDFVLFLRNNEFWNAQVVQIDVDADSAIVLIPRVGDHEIYLGDLENYEEKLHRLKVFYVEGLNKVGWGDYQRISLKFKNQVVCTKK